LIKISIRLKGQEVGEVVECFRHEGADCPRCDGSDLRPRKYCVECGEPSGKPSEGGKVLRLHRGCWFCIRCDPCFRFVDAVWSGLERMGD
jgi:hypothetical protein